METTARVITQIVDVLVLPFGKTHHTLQLVWLSLLTGVGMAYVFKLTSSQKAIKRKKDRLKARILEMRLYQDDLVLIFKGLSGALKGNFAYLGTIFVPFLIILIPVGVVFMQLDQRYSRAPLSQGSTVLLSVQLQEGFDPFETNVELARAEGVSVEGKPVRDAATRETLWSLDVDSTGTHQLTLYAKGTTYTFPLIVEENYRMIGSERSVSGVAEPLLHPGLPPLPAEGPFQRIRVEYPPARHWLLGMDVHWIVIFLVYSLISAAALKFLIGIEI